MAASVINGAGPVKDLIQLCRLLYLLSIGRSWLREIPIVMTSQAITLTATDNVVTSFRSEDLTNSQYPFVLRQVHVEDTTSESDWALRLKDKATGYTIFNWVHTRLLRGLYSGGTEKAGQPTPNALLGGKGGGAMGYPIGPDGGFVAAARSTGTATVTELSLKGVWVIS